MKKIMQGGILFILLGVMCADSSNTIPAIVFISIGILMIGVQQLCMQQKR